MKHGKKPTRVQKQLISAKGLNPGNWFVTKDTSTEVHIIHRNTDTVRIIRKD